MGYVRRNCWAAVEGSGPEIEARARLIGAGRMCISTDPISVRSFQTHVDCDGRRAPRIEDLTRLHAVGWS